MSPKPILPVVLSKADMPPRKPLIQGGNSGAQSSQTDPSTKDTMSAPNAAKMRPSSRPKLEFEKIVSDATARASDHAQNGAEDENANHQARALTAPKPRAHRVQPVIPLFPHRQCYNQNARKQTISKDRAVTDPVTSTQLLTANHQRSVSASHDIKFSSQNTVLEEEDDAISEMRIRQQIPSPPPQSPSKTMRVLGLYPIPKSQLATNQPPASAPPSTAVPEPYRASDNEHTMREASPVRMAQSTPVPPKPTRRWMRENGFPTPPEEKARALERLSTEKDHTNQAGAKEPGGMVLGDGKLSPTRSGTYGRAANVTIVDGVSSVRSHVASVIEGEDKARDEKRELAGDGPGVISQTTSVHLPLEAETLQPRAYSPSVYGGIWENNPAVGHSLPPFSPNTPCDNHHYSVMPNPYESEMQMRGVSDSNASGITIPMLFRGRPSEITPISQAFGSANSWADSRVNSGNSFAQQNLHTPAIVPGLFSENHNFVPPPPHGHPDFPPSTAPPPSSLTYMEATLHHHLDVVADRLSRIIVDKNDRVLDELIRRFSALEEKIDTGIDKILRSTITRSEHTRTDLRDVKNDLGTLKEDMKNRGKTATEIKKMVKNMDERFSGLELGMEDVSHHYQHMARAEPRPDNSIQEEYTTMSNTSPPKKTGGTYTGSPRRRRSSHSVVHTPQTNRNNPSTSHGKRRSDRGGTEGRPSADVEDRREYYAAMGRAMGQQPDLRAHPAYQSSNQLQDSTTHGQPGTDMPAALASGAINVLYQVPSNTNADWYHRTYGS